jgi:hypothetical protein
MILEDDGEVVDIMATRDSESELRYRRRLDAIALTARM